MRKKWSNIQFLILLVILEIIDFGFLELARKLETFPCRIGRLLSSLMLLMAYVHSVTEPKKLISQNVIQPHVLIQSLLGDCLFSEGRYWRFLHTPDFDYWALLSCGAWERKGYRCTQKEKASFSRASSLTKDALSHTVRPMIRRELKESCQGSVQEANLAWRYVAWAPGTKI